MNPLNPNAVPFVPRMSSSDMNLNQLLDTPPDFYDQVQPPSLSDMNLNQLLDTPPDFYDQVQSQPTQQSAQDQLQFKVSRGRRKVYNPITKRWVFNTKAARQRILTKKAKQQQPVQQPVFSQSTAQDQLRLKVSQGKKKVFNPKTNRWILDTKAARKRILTKKATQQPAPEPAPEPEQQSTPPTPPLPSQTIDLNLVQYSPIPSQEISFDPSRQANIPGQLTYGGIALNQITYVNKGSYGYVFKYASESPLRSGWRKVRSNSSGFYYYFNENERKSQWEIPREPGHPYFEIALKTYNYPDDEEINIVNELNRVGNRGICNLINSKIIYMNGKYAAVMDSMDGDMDKLVNLPAERKTKFIKPLVDNLVCISTLGIRNHCYYTDLKLGNVLFKYTPSGIKLVIGDIGGLCFDRNERGASTFPPPDTYYTRSPNCNDSSTVWGFGVLLVTLFGGDWRKYYHQTLRDDRYQSTFARKSGEYLTQLIADKKLDLLPIDGVQTTVGELLVRMLDPNPVRRITLQNIQQLVTPP